MLPLDLQLQIRRFRRRGRTYAEIKYLFEIVHIHIPKSTIAYWCRGVPLPKSYQSKVEKLNKLNLSRGREISSRNRKEKRETFLKSVDSNNRDLYSHFAHNNNSRKITLAILYLAEGSKTARGSLMFGNSDPAIVRMFVTLMRECYTLDERKFRCTLQCRADQNIKKLEKFWSKTTKIPLKQFYKARVDARTLGQVSKNQDYKGVCRIDYFSSAIDLELKRIAQQMLKSFS